MVAWIWGDEKEVSMQMQKSTFLERDNGGRYLLIIEADELGGTGYHPPVSTGEEKNLPREKFYKIGEWITVIGLKSKR